MSTLTKKFILILALVTGFLITGVRGQETIAFWDFDDESLEPTTGAGTATNIGGTTFTWAAGVTGNPDRAWNTSGYPAQNTATGTAGVQFDVSTSGYTNIVVNYFHRNSGTASRYVLFQYTTNGSAWIDHELFTNGPPHDTFYEATFDLSAIGAVNNNPNFGFRVVSVFSPEAFVDPQEPFTEWGPNEAYRATRDDRNYGTSGTWRFDNVLITGTLTTGDVPVKLAVTSVNNGASPTVNLPFPVAVQAQDANGVPANVTSATQVTLTRETGTGALGGTLVGTIPAGANSIAFDNVTYNTAESGVSIRASATSGMTLEHGISQPFTVLAAATQLAFVDVPQNGVIDLPLSAFTVEARRPDNTIDENFTSDITISKQSGPGDLSGTTTVAAVAGVAIFDDITLDATGSYVITADAAGLTSATSPEINIYQEPAISSVIVPQFISGNEPPDNRVPFAFRATISNLFPNTVYKYINQTVLSSDSPTTNGAGNVIFVQDDDDFFRVSGPNFSNPGGYGEFQSDQDGSYTGWFALEPTGNARFTPGNHVFMRMRLNDGAGGTSNVHYLTVPDSIKVIGFSTDADPDQGTAIRAISFATPKNFAFLYDNTGGSGRPIFGTTIETTGVVFADIPQYSQFYREDVAGFDGAWGGIVPNVNANGIKLIEERKLSDGTVADTHISSTGIWGDANTVNPDGGLENILVINLIEDPVVFVNPSTLSGFTYEVGEGPSLSQSYNVTGQNLLGSGVIEVTAPANYEISLDDQTFESQLQLAYLDGQIVDQPVEVHVRLKAGLDAGDYNNELIQHTAAIIEQVNVTLNGSVTAPVEPPSIQTEILPQFIQGINGSNVTRVPFAFRATISNLQPNSTYRYINQIVLSSDSPTTNGASNVIFVTQSGDFYRSSGPSFNDQGGYGELTSDNDGNFTGWFANEPTGNARFEPGNHVFMRVRLNDGMGGTSAEHYLTLADSVKVINFGTDNDPLQGTAIRGISNANPKNFAFLFDNISGTGRPVYGTTIETTGIDFTQISQYAPFYQMDVSGIDGAWGGIVPNQLPNGIQRFEERRLSNGTLRNSETSANGMWFNTNTVNPNGGLDDVLVLDLTTSLTATNPGIEFNVFEAFGEMIVNVPSAAPVTLLVTDIAGRQMMREQLSGSEIYQITHRLKTGVYIVSAVGGDKVFNTKIVIR